MTLTRQVLVLLHGWPQSSRIYDGVIDVLGSKSFTLAFDLPDIGDSRGAPPSGDKALLADILLSAAEQAGARSIIVAGFDIGGMIAFSAARDHGQRVTGAVVMNTVLPGIDPWNSLLADPNIWHFAFHAIPELPETLVRGHERAYFDFFFDALAGDPRAITNEQRDSSARPYARPEALRAGFDWYRAMRVDAERNAGWKEIRSPMLYLRGDADGGSPDTYVDGLRRAGVVEVTGGVLRGSGEFAPVEVPATFVRASDEFRSTCQGTVE